jgi:tetratricopeptide (TPR) repeat protein
MSFDQIMTEITSGLTGNPQEDVKSLIEQMRKYTDNEYSKEINRAIGRMIYEIVPEDMKNDLNKILNNYNLGIDKIMEEADFQIFKNNYEKALQIMESLIKSIEEREWYNDDNVSEYHCFNNFFEELIYKEKYRPSKEIRQIPENFTAAYYKYGVILFELKNFAKAKEVLEKANRYNPIGTEILFELSEVYKMNKDWEEYSNISKKCLEYAYSSRALARCYRNLGFYYIEQEKYDLAIKLFFFSMDFDQESKIAQSELLYISQKENISIQPPKTDEIIDALKKNNIQIGANPLILSIAGYIAKDAYKNKAFDICKYFSEIIYDLTNSAEFKNIIDQINSASVD